MDIKRELSRIMEPKLDRRSVRTRDSLRRALRDLIERKPYEQITSAEICEHANVGRSTFYVHFKGKDDLKASVFESLKRSIKKEAELAASGTWQVRTLTFARPVFEHAYMQRAHYRLIARTRGGKVALLALRRILLEHVRACLPADADPEQSYLPEYLVGAFLSVLVTWLDRGAHETAEHMDKTFKQWASRCIGERPAHGEALP